MPWRSSRRYLMSRRCLSFPLRPMCRRCPRCLSCPPCLSCPRCPTFRRCLWCPTFRRCRPFLPNLSRRLRQLFPSSRPSIRATASSAPARESTPGSWSSLPPSAQGQETTPVSTDRSTAIAGRVRATASENFGGEETGGRPDGRGFRDRGLPITGTRLGSGPGRAAQVIEQPAAGALADVENLVEAARTAVIRVGHVGVGRRARVERTQQAHLAAVGRRAGHP